MYENWVAESEYGENGRRNAESLVDLGRNGGMMDPGTPPLLLEIGKSNDVIKRQFDVKNRKFHVSIEIIHIIRNMSFLANFGTLNPNMRLILH